MKLGVLFDLDGTLLDTLDDLTDAVNYTMDVYNCPRRTTADIRAFIGNGMKWLLRMAVAERGDELDAEQVLQTYKEYYTAHCRIKTAPYPGVKEALAAVAARYPVAIVSNKPDFALKKMCPGYFGEVYALGERESCPRKPAPDMLYQAMKELGVDTCVYIGDTEVDVEAARNAGVPCISVLWGFRDREELAQAGAKHFCHKAEDLLPMIEKLTEELHGN